MAAILIAATVGAAVTILALWTFAAVKAWRERDTDRWAGW